MEEFNQTSLYDLQDGKSSKQKYKCKYCFKELSSRQNLREHVYIHTEEKPYACTEPGCGELFRQGSLLSIHRKIHFEVKKGVKISSGTVKKSTYPKLTELIALSKTFQTSLDETDITEIKETIQEKDFNFIRKYISLG
ncbi:hypothetical protein SteCoe_25364 [Stentor coeruleus]|uniref:C2H2-type domain-containing protein n=1 Tax=Stentor coeruleus TaxID=5963 RepID=A0A1R2BFB7_9CILI|nr:hypothetical protein SteCoe_25364 [Stentor coeruleus]